MTLLQLLHDVQALDEELARGRAVSNRMWLILIRAIRPVSRAVPNVPLFPIYRSFQKIRSSTSPCAICYDQTPTTILYPCRHNMFCQKCIRRNSLLSNQCPVCRQHISKAIVRRLNTGFVPTKHKPYLFGRWNY